MELSQLLSGLISGALTVPVVSFILNQLPPTLTSNQKRLAAFIAAFALGTGAFILATYFGYVSLPANITAWAEALWPVWTAAFTASQAVFSVTRFGKGPKPDPDRRVHTMEGEYE